MADIKDKKTYSYAIQKDGSLTEKKLFCEMGSDGMTIDSEGNVYLTGRGVTVFDSAGKQIAHIPVDAALDGQRVLWRKGSADAVHYGEGISVWSTDAGEGSGESVGFHSPATFAAIFPPSTRLLGGVRTTYSPGLDPRQDLGESIVNQPDLHGAQSGSTAFGNEDLPLIVCASEQGRARNDQRILALVGEDLDANAVSDLDTTLFCESLEIVPDRWLQRPLPAAARRRAN